MAQINVPKWHLGKWNQRLKTAACPSSLILSHTHTCTSRFLRYVVSQTKQASLQTAALNADHINQNFVRKEGSSQNRWIPDGPRQSAMEEFLSGYTTILESRFDSQVPLSKGRCSLVSSLAHINLPPTRTWSENGNHPTKEGYECTTSAFGSKHSQKARLSLCGTARSNPRLLPKHAWPNRLTRDLSTLVFACEAKGLNWKGLEPTYK